MARATVEALVARMITEVPALQPVHAEHLSDNFGELLPHVLFGDFTRFAERGFSAGDDRTRSSVSRLLEVLEEAMESRDEDIIELVSVSFLENLDAEASGYRQLRAAMGPRLRAELALHEPRRDAVVVVDGWSEGANKVALNDLLRTTGDLSLSEAKEVVDRVMLGREVRVFVREDRVDDFLVAAARAGFQCKLVR